MSKIRTIKPDGCRSKTLEAVSVAAALLFSRLPCFCDDEGRYHYDPQFIKSDIFPLRDHIDRNKCAELVAELEDAGLIELYSEGKKDYLFVCGFKEHQHVSRPTPSRLPIPPAEREASGTLHVDAVQLHAPTMQKHVDAVQLHAPTMQKHVDAVQLHAKTMQKHVDAVQLHAKTMLEVEVEVEVEVEEEVEVEKEENPLSRSRFREIATVCEFFNRETGKNFKPASKAVRKVIGARLADGYTVDELKTVVSNQVRDWKNRQEMLPYLRPATLFAPSKIDGYLNNSPPSLPPPACDFSEYDIEGKARGPGGFTGHDLEGRATA